MKLTPKWNKKDIERTLNNFFQTVEQQQIRRLQQLGEMCVTHAKEVSPDVGFTDQTGNLRSSMGYAVFKNGIAVSEAFEPVTTGTESGEEGVKKGRELAKSVARQNPNGLMLVVTAGMEYASVLESKNRDVLTSAEDLARQKLPEMLRKLKMNIDRSFK